MDSVGPYTNRIKCASGPSLISLLIKNRNDGKVLAATAEPEPTASYS